MSVVDRLVQLFLTEERLSRLNLREETQEDRDEFVPLIEFYVEPEWHGVFREPEHAKKNIANWWKKTPANLQATLGSKCPRDNLGAPVMSAKSCIPLLDGMTMGYTMVLPVDVRLRVSPDGKFVEIHNNGKWVGASTHDAIQLGGPNELIKGPAVKFHNPFTIRTRPGFSTLFIPPLNHAEETRFRCLGAAVDTDVYPKQVNFPALWLEPGYEGTIDAGTPLVTAIPYRRKDFKDPELLVRAMQPHERILIEKMSATQNTRSHMYTKELREPRK